MDKLDPDITTYKDNAQGNLRNLQFLQMVKAKLSPGQKVRDVLSEAQLERLMRKAEKGAEEAVG